MPKENNLLMKDVTSFLLKAKKLQLHYWFSDKSHTMDALVYNKCERELLEITKAISSLCGIAIKMETEPSARGGLKSWLTIHAKSEKKTTPIQLTMVATLVAAAMTTLVNGSIGSAANKLVAGFLADAGLGPDQQVQLRMEIDQLKAMLEDKVKVIEQSAVVKKRRSNFFEQLKKYQKVKTVSVAVVDTSRKNMGEEQFVAREAFTGFILVSGQVAPVVLENVSIEIVSPVLGVGNFKWKGKYLNAPISFTMKSAEFMALVQSGKVEFKSGTTINCTLEVEKKMNSEGVERITSYNILQVASYFENGKAVETSEGKHHRQKQNATRTQLDLFG